MEPGNNLKYFIMKISVWHRILFLFVVSAAFVQCSVEEIPSQGQDDSGRMVTLTLRRDAAMSDTKTALTENGEVVWTENDFIYVNGETYPVNIDQDDPSVATVSVKESKEYIASTTYFSLDGKNMYVKINDSQEYEKDSFDPYANHMVAYSTTTDLQFRNIGGVLRLGITGQPKQKIMALTFTANDGSVISGDAVIPLDDIRSGNYADSYPAVEDDRAPEDCRYIQMLCINDETEAITGVELNPTEPVYFNLVVPSQTYKEGFTVTMFDMDGNVAIKKMNASVTVPRSKIVPMSDFSFEPVERIKIEPAGSTATSLTYTVTGEPGMTVYTGVVYKSYYDSLPDSYEEDPDADWTKLEYGLSAIIDGEVQYATLGPDGRHTFTADKVSDANADPVDMIAKSDYYILACYISNGFPSFPVLAEAGTSVAEGSAPELSLAVSSETTYRELSATIAADASTSEIKVYLASMAEYENDKDSAMSDMDIVMNEGRILDEAALSEAVSGGFEYVVEADMDPWPAEDGYHICPGTDYVFIVLAIGENGAVSVKKTECTTPGHFPADAQWQTISETAELNVYTYVGAEIHGMVKLEKLEVDEIYRVAFDFTENEDFVAAMADSGYTRDSEGGASYIYFDATAEGKPTYVYPEESYIGFSDAEGRPVYLMSIGNRDSVSYDEWDVPRIYINAEVRCMSGAPSFNSYSQMGFTISVNCPLSESK